MKTKQNMIMSCWWFLKDLWSLLTVKKRWKDVEYSECTLIKFFKQGYEKSEQNLVEM